MMLVFFVVHPLPGADAAARSPNGHPSEVGLWTFFRVWGGGRVKRSYSRVVGREWKTKWKLLSESRVRSLEWLVGNGESNGNHVEKAIEIF